MQMTAPHRLSFIHRRRGERVREMQFRVEDLIDSRKRKVAVGRVSRRIETAADAREKEREREGERERERERESQRESNDVK